MPTVQFKVRLDVYVVVYLAFLGGVPILIVTKKRRLIVQFCRSTHCMGSVDLFK